MEESVKQKKAKRFLINVKKIDPSSLPDPVEELVNALNTEDSIESGELPRYKCFPIRSHVVLRLLLAWGTFKVVYSEGNTTYVAPVRRDMNRYEAKRYINDACDRARGRSKRNRIG